MRVLLLHGYSATNAGDGLLVEESVRLIREALGDATEMIVCAMYPESFAHVDATVIAAKPSIRGYPKEFRDVLRHVDEFDLVAGVGGGYLRFRSASEAAKSALIHLPQLRAAARARVPSVYLSQSVGPLRMFGPLVRRYFGRIDRLYGRDDKTMAEVRSSTSLRTPDLALLSLDALPTGERAQSSIPVMSVRSVRQSVPARVFQLGALLEEFDGFVQSRGAGNDDSEAMESLHPRRMLDSSEFLDPLGTQRVVVAVRLHAALMALRAGHVVVHLAYERKGFGAFEDLGLTEYVHSVTSFDPQHVQSLVRGLLTNPELRKDYEARVEVARGLLAIDRTSVLEDLRRLIGFNLASAR